MADEDIVGSGSRRYGISGMRVASNKGGTAERFVLKSNMDLRAFFMEGGN